VPAPLLTPDARDLRLLVRPKWQRRVLAWTVPVGAFVVTIVHTAAVGTPQCTASAPCRPDIFGSVVLGLLFVAASAGAMVPRLAVWPAGAFAVGIVVDEQLLRLSTPSPSWTYLFDLAFVGLCLVAGGVDRHRRPTARAAGWLASVPRERPPEPVGADLPRPGRIWRFVAVVLAALAAGSLAWGFYAQVEADAQQAAAARISAEVTSIVDELTIAVRLPGGESATISVYDSAHYPVGRPIELYVDDRGLRQPVAEPYDATGWHFLAVALGGIGLLCRRRGAEELRRPRRLFAEEQPVTEVSVRPGAGVLAVYAGDARTGEPAVAEIRTNAVNVVAGEDGQPHLIGLDLEPGVQPATLYGVPAAGRWCTVVVAGQPVVPTRPLSSRVSAPPYGLDLGGALPPPMADPPLRTEDVAALRTDDRDGDPYAVRVHRRHPATGYATAAAMPLVLVPLVNLLPTLAYEVLLLVAAVAVAPSSWLAWRLFLRSRIAWNQHGIAVVGAVGAKRVPWRMVRSIEHDNDSVTIHTGYSGLVVGAGPFLGVIGRGGRTAAELANALRLARAAGPDTAVDAADPPTLEAPRPPAGLFVLWLLYTPLLAWLFLFFSTN
jgi:hypothetical protein